MPATREQFDQAMRSLQVDDATTDDFPRVGEIDPELGKILGQRLDQRDQLFKFAVWSSLLSLIALVGTVIIQASVRVFGDTNFEVISSQSLQVFAVAVFGQLIGVVLVIARALWNDKEYLSAINKGRRVR